MSIETFEKILNLFHDGNKKAAAKLFSDLSNDNKAKFMSYQSDTDDTYSNNIRKVKLLEFYYLTL